MVDTRQCYTMETGYTSSDFSFYRKNPNTLEVGPAEIRELQVKAGRELWYKVGSYTHYWKSGCGQDYVLILTNDKGVQIETCSFGWRRVITEHELALTEKNRYNNFYAALAECGKLCPTGASCWFNEAVLESFGNEFEDILDYGD